MSHIGILYPGAIGHLNPMCNLGAELVRRGHQVTLFGVPDVKALIGRNSHRLLKSGIRSDQSRSPNPKTIGKSHSQ